MLTCHPKVEGLFQISAAKWKINESSLASGGGAPLSLSILTRFHAHFESILSPATGTLGDKAAASDLTLVGKRSLAKKGQLLQKTLKQRNERLREEESFLQVRVVAPQPLLQGELTVPLAIYT